MRCLINHIASDSTFFKLISNHLVSKMRFLSILLSVTGLLTVHVFSNPTGDLTEVESIEKRGCNTGNWCCTVANPSAYCAKYCAGGSQYINCYESYVSKHSYLSAFVVKR